MSNNDYDDTDDDDDNNDDPLTFDVVFGDAFASRSRLTICEWPCWAACKKSMSNCIHSMKVDLNLSAFRISPLASKLKQSGGLA